MKSLKDHCNVILKWSVLVEYVSEYIFLISKSKAWRQKAKETKEKKRISVENLLQICSVYCDNRLSSFNFPVSSDRSLFYLTSLYNCVMCSCHELTVTSTLPGVFSKQLVQNNRQISTVSFFIEVLDPEFSSVKTMCLSKPDSRETKPNK